MVYELRIYTASEGKRRLLIDRFRDHTIALFGHHGMRVMSFFTSASDDDVLVYLLQHEGDTYANWDAFHSDPRWAEAKSTTEVDGPLTAKVERLFLDSVPLT